jgi:hypothetical protein
MLHIVARRDLYGEKGKSGTTVSLGVEVLRLLDWSLGANRLENH